MQDFALATLAFHVGSIKITVALPCPGPPAYNATGAAVSSSLIVACQLTEILGRSEQATLHQRPVMAGRVRSDGGEAVIDPRRQVR